MKNYSNNPAHCRVDFFKESGKWYCTEMVDFDGLYDDLNAFAKALQRHLSRNRHSDGSLRLSGMIAICLEPCWRWEHPQMTRIPESGDFIWLEQI